MNVTVVCLLVFQLGAAVAQFYSMSGYACGQPALYTQCQCPAFCSFTVRCRYCPTGSTCEISIHTLYVPYTGMKGGYGDYSGYNGRYRSRYRSHKRRHHKKKKFRIETVEESEEFPEPPSTTPKTTTHTWEDEDLWEKKFVGEKTKGTGSSEELPEISSAEIEAARARAKATEEDGEMASHNTHHHKHHHHHNGGESQFASGGGMETSRGRNPGGIGLGTGVDAAGVGVNSGLGIGAPGIGGLGNGGLFGISSGIGVGVPGVGPIGVSSGLGIGR